MICIQCFAKPDFAILHCEVICLRFPCLIRQKFCNKKVHLTLYGEGINENGSPIEIYKRETIFPSNDLYPSDNLYGDYLMCNYQCSAKTVFTAQQKQVVVNATLLIPGDIIPDSPTISGGFAVIDGIKRNIVNGVKAYNPDGTVNFTELNVV